MEDINIIGLFFQRNEKAIAETQKKYGEFIKAVAFNITEKAEDVIECENDTYLKLWNSIPPERPEYLKAYIGKITRNSALSRYRFNTAAKRDSKLNVLLSELEECIPAVNNVEDEFDSAYLSGIISDWLYTIDEESRALFIKRYWYGESIKKLSEQTGISSSRLSSRMFSLRKKLKHELTVKGVNI